MCGPVIDGGGNLFNRERRDESLNDTTRSIPAEKRDKNSSRLLLVLLFVGEEFDCFRTQNKNREKIFWRTLRMRRLFDHAHNVGKSDKKPQYPVAQQECYSCSPKKIIFSQNFQNLVGFFFFYPLISGGECAK